MLPSFEKSKIDFVSVCVVGSSCGRNVSEGVYNHSFQHSSSSHATWLLMYIRLSVFLSVCLPVTVCLSVCLAVSFSCVSPLLRASCSLETFSMSCCILSLCFAIVKYCAAARRNNCLFYRLLSGQSYFTRLLCQFFFVMKLLRVRCVIVVSKSVGLLVLTSVPVSVMRALTERFVP